MSPTHSIPSFLFLLLQLLDWGCVNANHLALPLCDPTLLETTEMANKAACNIPQDRLWHWERVDMKIESVLHLASYIVAQGGGSEMVLI